jgi:hypothetical protein
MTVTTTANRGMLVMTSPLRSGGPHCLNNGLDNSCQLTPALSDAPLCCECWHLIPPAYAPMRCETTYLGLLGPRASQLLNRLKKRRTIEINLISIDQTVSELNGANAVNVNAALPDWHRGMPFVQKTVANGN